MKYLGLPNYIRVNFCFARKKLRSAYPYLRLAA